MLKSGSKMATEIHYVPKYMPPFFKGFLYTHEPEMVIDFPQNIYGTKIIPFVFITNHSQKYPVENIYIEINLFSASKTALLSENFTIAKISAAHITAHFFYIDCSDIIGDNPFTKLFIKATAKCCINNKKEKRKSFTFSNIKGCSPEILEINIYKNKFMAIDGCVTGDMHVHTSVSNDQVEFGYPTDVYKEIAKFTNLDFLSITDHSYDIDKKEGFWYQKDCELEQWNKILNSNIPANADIEVICGEEVSCGNSKSENVHLLSIGNTNFITGNGDSGEKLFKNKPDNFLSSILNNHQKAHGFFAAAHPLVKINFAEKFLLNRGTYNQSDMENITHIQFVNSNPWVNCKRDIQFFDALLSKYGKKYLIAGNDAHGYLGWCPQIKIPLIKASYNFANIFSKNRTVVFKKMGETTLEAIKKGNCAITTGNYIVYIKSAKNGDTKILIHNNNCLFREIVNLTIKFFDANGSIISKNITVDNDFVSNPTYIANIASPSKFIFCYAIIMPQKTDLIAVSNVVSSD